MKRFSKEEWSRQAAAQEAKGTRGTSEPDAEVEGGDDGMSHPAVAEAAATCPAAPAIQDATLPLGNPEPGETQADEQKRQRKRKHELVEAACFFAFVLPAGRVEFSSSIGVRDFQLARDHRDNFVAALNLMVRQRQLEASVDKRVQLRAQQAKAAGETLLPQDKHMPPSKRLRAAARDAYMQHVQPRLHGLAVCDPDQWKKCVIKEGSSEEQI